MKNRKTYRLALLALFIAIEITLVFTPLGYIQLGAIQPTTCHVPVILAGLILGRRDGAIMGVVFGLSSILYGTMMPSPASLFFSPFYSGNILSGVVALLPRILLGYGAGALFEVFKKKDINENVRVIATAVIMTVAHTIMVLGLIYVFFGHLYAETFNLEYGSLLKTFVLSIFSTNGLFEIALAALICWPVYKAISLIK